MRVKDFSFFGKTKINVSYQRFLDGHLSNLPLLKLFLKSKDLLEDSRPRSS